MGENILKVEPGSYYGYPIGKKSIKGFNDELLKQYNETPGPAAAGPVPGWIKDWNSATERQSTIAFIDIAKVEMLLFDYRTGK